MFKRILCAIDRGDTSPKILRHAAGLAAAFGGRLSVVHASNDRLSEETAFDIRRRFADAVPYGAGYIEHPEVRIVSGRPADAIVAEAARWGADLIVTGTRGHRRVAGWLLGSTTRALLEATSIPILLLPGVDLDIVTLAPERPLLNVGAVIAAIDFSEHNARQLHVASEVAALAQRPLIMLTVLAENDRSTDHQAADALRGRAHKLTPVRPHAVVVRRGDVAQEIARCAMAEDAGLVIMGLRSRLRGQRPGVIASAVLALQRPAVLAVPDAGE